MPSYDDLQKLAARVDQAIDQHEPYYPNITTQTFTHLNEQIDRFIQAIVDKVKSQPPSVPSPSVEAHALSLENRPVFIGGVAKSGTSLVRNLLDGHPQLAVFPAEAALFSQMQVFATMPYDAQRAGVLDRSLRRLIIADVGGGARWLLSGGKQNVEHYAQFVALYYYRANQLPSDLTSLFRSVIFAYLLARMPSQSEINERRWVEKSPKNVAMIHELVQIYPKAKFIVCVRDPRAVVASTKFRHQKKYGNFKLQHTVETMRHSWKQIFRVLKKYDSNLYRLVHYEELSRFTRAEMERLANFLEIDFHESLLRPSQSGQAASPNTGFERPSDEETVSLKSIDRWRTVLSDDEINFVSASMHPYTAQLGYEAGETSVLAYLRAVLGLARNYPSRGLAFSIRKALQDRIMLSDD